MKNKYNHAKYDILASRGCIPLHYLISGKNEKCCDILVNSNMGLRPKDISMLSISYLGIDDYENCIKYLTQLKEFSNTEWPTDGQSELLCFTLAYIAQKTLSDMTNFVNNAEDISSSMIERVFERAELYFSNINWFEASKFYLIAALSYNRNNLYWGYFAQSVLR